MPSGLKRSLEEGALPATKRSADYASCSTSESAGAREEQRAERHYIMRVDDRFDGDRYRVIKQLGKGTFGRVVEMWDEKEQRHVAVKVVRAVEKYSREAEIEAEILLKVQSGSALDLPIGRLIRTFTSQGHCCLVFDKLGPSLYHALRGVKREAERRSRGRAFPLHAGRFFSLAQISRVALDCFRTLAHLHSIKLAHTDLKPENILFTAPGRPDVTSGTAGLAIIDFGGATWEHEHHSSIVCTRQYRPAEVTLSAGWDSSVDLWSMGCILAELWTVRSTHYGTTYYGDAECTHYAYQGGHQGGQKRGYTYYGYTYHGYAYYGYAYYGYTYKDYTCCTCCTCCTDSGWCALQHPRRGGAPRPHGALAGQPATRAGAPRLGPKGREELPPRHPALARPCLRP